MSDFSKQAWAGGCLLALIYGAVLNFMAMAISFRINITVVAAILGMIPGIALFFVARRDKRRDFGGGLVVGACVVALLGGLCSAIGTATQSR